MAGQAATMTRDAVRSKIRAIETNSQVKVGGGKKSKGMEKC